MTEAEWDACTEQLPMLELLWEAQRPDRKWWAFTLACHRAAWDPRSQHELEVAERALDGLASQEEMRYANLLSYFLREPAEVASEAAGLPDSVGSSLQANLLRDIFGPLAFRTLRFDPRWRTPLVLSLAQAAYDERVAPDPSRPGWLTLDPARLLVLADALEDAGVDDLEIFGHLRRPDEHVRGCFVVDWLLGKS